MNSMKNHRIVVTRHGGPDVLQVVEEDLPEPEAGEVRVKVLTAGVSAFPMGRISRIRVTADRIMSSPNHT